MHFLKRNKAKTARDTAVDILINVTENGAYNNITLRTALQGETLSQQDKALVTEIVNGTLRNLIRIDYIINNQSKTPTKKLKPLILGILRASVYQLAFLDRIPAYSVINEAVEIAKGRGLSGLTGFVNGVLRGIQRSLSDIKYPDVKKDFTSYVSIYYSYPMWIVKYFETFLTKEEILNICEANSIPHKVSIFVNTLKTTKEQLIQRLTDEGVTLEEGRLENSFIIKEGLSLDSPSLREGLFLIIDESSIQAVTALNPKAGDTVLDMCAAPGGKSFLSAIIMGNKGEIISSDIHPHKIKLIKDGAQKLGISIIKTEIADAKELNSKKINIADCVLVDAPCSGFGILSKKPDIKYTKQEKDIKELSVIQQRILKNAADYVKPGGTLVYSTCTISKSENEDNVERFLQECGGDFTLERVETLFPTESSDGFFIAKFKKESARN